LHRQIQWHKRPAGRRRRRAGEVRAGLEVHQAPGVFLVRLFRTVAYRSQKRSAANLGGVKGIDTM